ncbi:MAG: recombination mediator RecR [Minisyncoccia bacterium]
MLIVPKPIKNLADSLSQLPGIGPRQSLRLAFFLIRQPKEKKLEFYKSLKEVFSKIKLCSDCFFPFEARQNETLCEICRDKTRNRSLICVVEKETDVLSIENTNKYRGLYHILGGLVSDIDEKKNQEITLKQLLLRIQNRAKQNQPVKEIILALNPTSEGNLTSYYLEKEIKKLNLSLKITKLARGLPTGGDIEFADSETLISALEGRK